MKVSEIYRINEEIQKRGKFTGESARNGGAEFLRADGEEVLLQIYAGMADLDDEIDLCVVLPHQCDEWQIGEIDQLKQLHHDLDLMIELLSVKTLKE